MLKVPKPKNARSKRALEKRSSKVIENVKKAIFIRGSTTSNIVNNALLDLYTLKKPDAINFTKKNDIHPFDDSTSLEFFARKNDASLMVFGNHSKKRPNNLTFIRLFDYTVLDMIEVGVVKAKFIKDFKSDKCALGNKPCFLFNGEEFEQDEIYIRFKNILIDMYHGQVVDQINLQGLEHVIVVTTGPATTDLPKPIHLRVYSIDLKKSGTRIPRVELIEMGPSFDMTIRRTQLADSDQMKVATRVPKELKPKKKKNIEHDDMGDKYGRIHMEKQDFGKLQTRKMKGLKKSTSLPGDDGDESDSESEGENVASGSDEEDDDGVEEEDDDDDE